MTDIDLPGNFLPDIDSLWDYGNPAETERQFRELLPQAANAPAYRLELLTQIARTLSLQRRFEEAHAVLDDVDSDLANNETPRVRIRALLERGRTFNSAGERDRARGLFEQALEAAIQSNEDALAVDAAHMVAIAAPPDEALAWNLRALRLAEGSSDPAALRWLGYLYNNIGWTYHSQGDFEQALHYLELSRDVRTEIGQEKGLLIARWCVARVERDIGHVEEALSEQMALSTIYEERGQPSGYVFEEIAECLSLMNKPEMARPYFAQAWDILSQDPWLVAEEPERLERLQRLGAT